MGREPLLLFPSVFKCISRRKDRAWVNNQQTGLHFGVEKEPLTPVSSDRTSIRRWEGVTPFLLQSCIFDSREGIVSFLFYLTVSAASPQKYLRNKRSACVFLGTKSREKIRNFGQEMDIWPSSCALNKLLHA